MDDLILIRKVKEPFGWMGNMAPFPVSWGGREWRTTEALFQALRFDDLAVQEEIRNSKSPMGAKMIAKREAGKMVVTPRSPVDLDNMRMLLKLKVAQHPQLGVDLRATLSRPIIEDCTKRPSASGLFWGARLTGTGWDGENHLGKLWTELRSALKDTE